MSLGEGERLYEEVKGRKWTGETGSGRRSDVRGQGGALGNDKRGVSVRDSKEEKRWIEHRLIKVA